jgi:hypothetical protein
MRSGRSRSEVPRDGALAGGTTSRVFGALGGWLLGLGVSALCESLCFLAAGWPAPVDPWKVHPTGLFLGGLLGALVGGYFGIAVPARR